MERHLPVALLIGGGIALAAGPAHGQAPEGPIVPQPGVEVQQAPPGKTIKLHSVLVNTPVTVRDTKGEMVHNLEAKDFHVTDNGVEQKISHFDLGSEPLSIVVVVETSARISAILPEIRKTGTLLTQAGGTERRNGDCGIQRFSGHAAGIHNGHGRD